MVCSCRCRGEAEEQGATGWDMQEGGYNRLYICHANEVRVQRAALPLGCVDADAQMLDLAAWRLLGKEIRVSKGL
jgi:hypothetical protein